MCGVVADCIVEHTAVRIIHTLNLQRETDAEIRHTDAGQYTHSCVPGEGRITLIQH